MSLEREIQELRSIVAHLSSEVIRLSSEVTRLEKENKELRTRLQRYEHPKNTATADLQSVGSFKEEQMANSIYESCYKLCRW